MKGHRSKILFAVVSAICMMTHNIIMILLDFLGVPLLLAIVVSFGIVGGVGYAGHSSFVFRQPMSFPGFGRYILSMTMGVGVAIPIIYCWKVGLALPMWIAAPAASLCTTIINYLLVRWAIMRPTIAGE
ncbi:GtrA family protein [Komagataeibacter sp. AV436]|uniref:GtrA family protein n=1 Tax=Komagataeibacter melomenusus TaxID=2766578 RepID=A0ABX2AFT0_9PROT|nr:GtrA family protein [Komagataeibacter melomenusus]MBV1831304.1 GtrA family protein [Komagataeibacter melomenusus]NPC67045.1 GtrA family protein [Komagataeibacter melomenusus]